MGDDVGRGFAPAQFGANFELAVRDDAPGWTPLTHLLEAGALIEREENTRAAIGRVGATPREIRAVASMMALGLFSRLLSPILGAAVLDVAGPVPDPATTWFAPVPRGTIPLATSAPLARVDPRDGVDGLVMPLIEPMSKTYRLSRRVLLGNVAAAVAGSCGVIAGVRPDLSSSAEELRAELLTTPDLAGTGTPRGPFIRSSCCLIWQLPMHYICSNCVLVDAGTRMIRERDDDRAGSPGFRRRWRPQLEEARRTHTFRGTGTGGGAGDRGDAGDGGDAGSGPSST